MNISPLAGAPLSSPYRHRFWIIWSVVLCAGLLLIGGLAHASEKITVDRHQLTVIDGDTIEFGGTVYQLAGIDAPELGQVCDHDGHLWLCGLHAAYELRKLISLQVIPIKCYVRSRAAPLPIVACMLHDSEISEIMLEDGYAVALPKSAPYYKAAEDLAKAASVGIWGSAFIPPPAWRDGDRLPNEHRFKGSSHPTEALPWLGLERRILLPKPEHAACMVKGRITDKNERFYYSPLDEDYEAIKISPERGERYFCGDEEARRAGWIRQHETAH